ncbi:hypothetical protein CPB83DRAFT_900118 [Crepidotus variabilis]|uniref:CCHC-type domain-containing protein n=1 Tax=Crepidotus variabilis TaxID=179855 RepID=A0A9P6E3M8_9AGAR|nr:hypothetical protein CPB83DRAFT_900118 [Crepidotus variabilis]
MTTSTSSPMLPIIEGIIRDIAFQPFIEPTSPDSGSSRTLVDSYYEGEQTDTGEYQSNLSPADIARLQQWENGNSDDDIVYPRYSRYTEDLRRNNYDNFMAQTVNQRINLLSDQPAIPIRLRTFEEETLPPVNGITMEDFNETFEDWAQLHHLLSDTNISPTLAHALISSRTHFLAHEQLDKLIKEAVETICKIEQRSEESLRLAKHFFDLATDRGLNEVEVIRRILLERNTQQNAQTTVIDEGEGRVETANRMDPPTYALTSDATGDVSTSTGNEPSTSRHRRRRNRNRNRNRSQNQPPVETDFYSPPPPPQFYGITGAGRRLTERNICRNCGIRGHYPNTCPNRLFLQPRQGSFSSTSSGSLSQNTRLQPF